MTLATDVACFFDLFVVEAVAIEPPHRSSSSSRAEGVVATLSLPADTVIAGMPFDIEIQLSNASSNQERVGVVSQLVLVLPDGSEAPFRMKDVLQPWGASSVAPFIELEPGESVIRSFTWSRWSVPNWMFDYRISPPGSYDIRFEIGPTEDDAGTIPTVRTNTVRLTRTAGSEIDQEVWQKMVSAGGGRWPAGGFISVAGGKALMEEILTSHPDSAYFPYALTFKLQSATLDAIPDMEQLMAWAESPAYPQLLTAAGDTSLRVAKLSKGRGDILSASEAYRQADAFYKAAVRTGSTGVREAVGWNHREVQRNLPE